MEVEDAVQEGCWYWRHLVEEIHRQLALWGSETLILKAQAIPNPAERRREIRLIEHATAVMGELTEDDLSFVHSGLCQTALPHQRLASNDEIWQRSSGRFHLMISPGVIRNKEGQPVRVGVPYGTRARLIMIFLQSEGIKSPNRPSRIEHGGLGSVSRAGGKWRTTRYHSEHSRAGPANRALRIYDAVGCD